MANRFANGAKSYGFCDRCGFRFDLKKLKNEVVKTKQTQIKSCPQCWSEDHPQLQLGLYPISDPQAIRDPRPDTNTWYQSGTNGLQTSPTSGLLPANPFTADGTTTVLVNAPNHGALTGTYVTFSGATVFSGVVIVGQYQLTVVNANSYAITYATPVPAGNGGGSAVTFAYQPAAGVLQQGYPGEGMLVIQWGWNPIGGARDFDAVLTPNTLVGVGEVGQVTIGNTGTPQFTLVEVLYTTPGTYSWTAPAGITSIYVLCIGAGGPGVTGVPIQSVSSYFGGPGLTTGFVAGSGTRGDTVSAGIGGGQFGNNNSTALGNGIYGGNGGNGASRSNSNTVGGGGGAGGYAGDGGAGGNQDTSFTAGSGGGGAGGAYVSGTNALSGGGVGITGQGNSGIVAGQGGSGGTAGTTSSPGLYGAGGRGLFSGSANGGGGGGALRWTPNRIVNPGTTYTIRVAAGGGSGVAQSGSGAVKIAYWQPIP
jgi:hypothetical protein